MEVGGASAAAAVATADAGADSKTAERAGPVVFNVGMTCGGCARACTKILSKIDGVETVEPSVEDKIIRVFGSADPQVMLAALMKWSAVSGKPVALAKA